MDGKRVNVDQLLEDLRAAAEEAGFAVQVYGQAGAFPLLVFRRGGAPGARRIYLSAGMHGDEPAGPLALLQLLREDGLPPGPGLMICPVLNPQGLEGGTRENPAGVDLNRDYTDFASEEARLHRDLLERADFRPGLSLLLHEDWEAKGFYLYELNFDGLPSRAPAMLAAAGAVVPVETAKEIDGHPASGGVIRPERPPDVPEGLPEAIYLQRIYGGLNYTIESPSGFPLEKRVAALVAAVRAGIG